MAKHTGVPMTAVNTGLGISRTLSKIAHTHADPHKRKVKKGRTGPKRLLTDEQTAHIKWLLEFGGKTTRQVAEAFGLSIEHVYRLFNHSNRVAPKRHPNPTQLFPIKEAQ